MRTRRLALAFLVITAVALVAPLPGAAKEGVRATLTTTIPLDADPGAQLEVAWTLASVGQDGQRRPFGASGVYVRLLSASGADAETGFADSATGEYTASVAVPEGGIGDIEVGLVGWVSDARGTRRSDAFFPITNDPLPGVRIPSPGFPGCLPDDCVDPSANDAASGPARAASAGSGQSGSEHADTRSTTWILIAIAGCLLALGAFAVAVVRRRHAVLPILALALLAFASPAHAKEIERALVCGLDGCTEVRKPGGAYAGSPGDSMPSPGPYYRIELFFGEMTGHPSETIFYVPGARAAASSWDGGAYLWSEPPDAAVKVFDRITRGVRPFLRPVFHEVTIDGTAVEDPRSYQRLLILRDSGPTRLGEADWQLVEFRSARVNPWSLSIIRYSPGSRILSRSLEWVSVPPRLAGAIESRSSLEDASRGGFAWRLVTGWLAVAFGLALGAVLLVRRSARRAETTRRILQTRG